MYNFFSDSTARWKILQTFAASKSITLKSLSTTRWSAGADAVSVLTNFWQPIIYQAVKSIEENLQEKAATRSTAKGLRLKFEDLETAILLKVWSPLLSRFKAVSTKVQGRKTTIGEVCDLYKSLILLVDESRENFDLYERSAKEMSINKTYKVDKKRRKHRKLQADENDAGDTVFSGRDDFRVKIFIPILDALKTQLETRYAEYKVIGQKFQALLEFGELDENDLRAAAEVLQNSFKDESHLQNDLETSFADEIVHFKHYCKGKGIQKHMPAELLQHIRENGLEFVFPNVDIAYRLFNCTSVTNCAAERSFSCLKRIKNYLRNSITEDRLNDLK